MEEEDEGWLDDIQDLPVEEALKHPKFTEYCNGLGIPAGSDANFPAELLESLRKRAAKRKEAPRQQASAKKKGREADKKGVRKTANK